MLSQILRKLRENSGFTQQQIAEVLNIDRSTYAYYEAGKTTPDINTIIKLSKVFNVPYTQIFESEENSTYKFSDLSLNDINKENKKYGRKNGNHIYELTKQEQQIIINYRLLSTNDQLEILDMVYKKTGEYKKDIN